jgi:hypothetical protein
MTVQATDAGIVDNLSQVATFFGVAPGTVRGDWRQSGMPGQRGAWDLKKIMAWKNARLGDPVASRAAANPSSTAARKQMAEVVLVVRKCERLQIELDRMRGELINRDTAQQELASILSIIKSRLQGIPEDVVLELNSRIRPKVRRSVAHTIDLVLRQLATTRLLGLAADDVILAEADKIREKRVAAATDDLVQEQKQ